MVGRTDPLTSEDDAAGREIRAGNDVDQFVDGQGRIFNQRDTGVDNLTEIMRQNVVRHADCDAAGAVAQQVREYGRQNPRLAFGTVVVGLEIVRVFVDVAENR